MLMMTKYLLLGDSQIDFNQHILRIFINEVQPFKIRTFFIYKFYALILMQKSQEVQLF